MLWLTMSGLLPPPAGLPPEPMKSDVSTSTEQSGDPRMDGANRCRHDGRAAVREIVPIHHGDVGVGELHAQHRRGNAKRLQGIHRVGKARSHRAESAPARARVPEDHEARRAVRAPALVEIRATRLLAHGMKPFLVDEILYGRVAFRRVELDLQPGRQALRASMSASLCPLFRRVMYRFPAPRALLRHAALHEIDELCHLDLAGADAGALEMILASPDSVRRVQGVQTRGEAPVPAVLDEARRLNDGRRAEEAGVVLQHRAGGEAGGAVYAFCGSSNCWCCWAVWSARGRRPESLSGREEIGVHRARALEKPVWSTIKSRWMGRWRSGATRITVSRSA